MPNGKLRVGRIPYINCYPVYGAVDRGAVHLDATLVDGVPTALNRQMAEGMLDVSVVSAVEYARDAKRYLLLPDLAISCDGPVRSVLLFSKRPATELNGRRVLVSRSSMTSVALLELLFENVWKSRPIFVPANAEVMDVDRFGDDEHDARLVIGDAALVVGSRLRAHRDVPAGYSHAYDLGAEWKRITPVAQALAVHATLIQSRDWGLTHLDDLAAQASDATEVDEPTCLEYLSGLDYGLSYHHLAGLTEFFRRLVMAGRVPNGSLAFLPAA
jgi:chorismate dehydratase